MSIIDAVIILFLLLGAVLGFKRGVIKSVVSCLGTILIVLLAFWLKDYLAVILYTYLPFFHFAISAINILIYEAIAFLIILALLTALLRIIIKISGLLELMLKFTVVLAIPSKILGAIFGFLEYYVFTFVILFIFACCNINSELINESKLADKILANSPVISNMAEDTYAVIQEFTSISKKNTTITEKNAEANAALLKYKIVSQESMDRLNKKNKLEKIISYYGKDE